MPVFHFLFVHLVTRYGKRCTYNGVKRVSFMHKPQSQTSHSVRHHNRLMHSLVHHTSKYRFCSHWLPLSLSFLVLFTNFCL